MGGLNLLTCSKTADTPEDEVSVTTCSPTGWFTELSAQLNPARELYNLNRSSCQFMLQQSLQRKGNHLCGYFIQLASCI